MAAKPDNQGKLAAKAIEDRPTSAPATNETAASDRPLIARLLRMGDRYLADNQTHQARELFFTILDEYPETPEAALAYQRIVAMAEYNESVKEEHQARATYERLVWYERATAPE